MYNNVGAAGGVLAATGLTGNLVWGFLAAFAFLALGTALMRIAPRREG